MAIRIFDGNAHIDIYGLPPGVARKLDKATSYYVEGFQFDPRFKRKHWDGREHLLKFHARHEFHRLPIGLRLELKQILEDEGLTTTTQTVPAPGRTEPPVLDLQWEGPELRDYQHDAIAGFCDMHPGKAQGRGILSLPIRSGKTLTAAAVARVLKTTAIFLVPSQLLLGQTVKTLTEALGIEVGVIGEGNWDPRDVTVATVQSLARRRTKRIASAKPEYLDLLKRFGLIVFDEVHHLTGAQWHKVMADFDARYRLGLSATALLEDKREISRGVIWLKASTGPIAHHVGMSRLIREGYLLRPTVKLHQVREPDLSKAGWSAALKKKGIYLNEWRNNLIAILASEHAHRGRRILVVSKSLAQVDALIEAIGLHGHTVEKMIGSTPYAERRHLIEQFVAGKIPIIVGTVFGEGVDIPECEVVINADGGRDKKATIQRMRCLTPSPGKEGAFFDDFLDFTNEYLAKHSLERLRVYKDEEEFDIEIVSYAP